MSFVSCSSPSLFLSLPYHVQYSVLSMPLVNSSCFSSVCVWISSFNGPTQDLQHSSGGCDKNVSYLVSLWHFNYPPSSWVKDRMWPEHDPHDGFPTVLQWCWCLEFALVQDISSPSPIIHHFKYSGLFPLFHLSPCSLLWVIWSPCRFLIQHNADIFLPSLVRQSVSPSVGRQLKWKGRQGFLAPWMLFLRRPTF